MSLSVGGSGICNQMNVQLASFPVLPTPAFVSQPWRKSKGGRQKLGWEALGIRLRPMTLPGTLSYSVKYAYMYIHL